MVSVLIPVFLKKETTHRKLRGRPWSLSPLPTDPCDPLTTEEDDDVQVKPRKGEIIFLLVKEK